MRRLDQDLVEAIMLKAGFQPLEPYINHRHKWKSQCLTCKKISTPTLKMVKKKNTGCAYCAKVKIDGLEAMDIMLQAGLLPKRNYVDSKSPWECECMTCGATVFPRYNSIQSGQGGCSACGDKSRADLNRTEQDVAINMAKSRSLEPLEDYVNRSTPWECRCLLCGNIVHTSLKNMQRGSGCKYCAKNGFDDLIPATFYLISHKALNSIKIGITNDNSIPNRLDVHKSHGWEIEKKYYFDKGHEAEEVELKILMWLRKELQFPIHLTSEMMPQRGHTETVNADSITVLEIQKKVEELIKGYRINP
jgi:hypothetical protein